MGTCTLPIGVSALACAIAETISDPEDLALLAAVLVQLGDTLATIAVQREHCKA